MSSAIITPKSLHCHEESDCCYEVPINISEDGPIEDKVRWLSYNNCVNQYFINTLKNNDSKMANKLDEHSERLSLLETLLQNIENIINAIETQLESVKQWLFFWSYRGIEENVCDAIKNECYGEGCIDECSQEEINCADENTRWYCQLQVDGCYDKIYEGCIEGEICENGVCISEPQEQKVIFRTNVVNGNYYYDYNNSWIALDRGNDGNLEGYGYSGKSSWSSSRCNTNNDCDSSSIPCILVYTPTGDKVVEYTTSSKVLVCDKLNYKQVFYQEGYNSASAAELSNTPKEPYASNNQEVYG